MSTSTVMPTRFNFPTIYAPCDILDRTASMQYADERALYRDTRVFWQGHCNLHEGLLRFSLLKGARSPEPLAGLKRAVSLLVVIFYCAGMKSRIV